MILDLGLISYEEGYLVQKGLVIRRKLGEIDDSVILAEHNPVFTIGKTAQDEKINADRNLLQEYGIKVLHIDRGGDITFHGPGQIVLYPIVDLRYRGKDVHRYLRDLEDVAIRFLKLHSVSGERMEGRTGVWVGGSKIASIGIAVSNWVTYHGLSINIDCDLNFFSLIDPCGIKDVKVTTLSRVLNKTIPMQDVKADLLRSFNLIFDLNGIRPAREEMA